MAKRKSKQHPPGFMPRTTLQSGVYRLTRAMGPFVEGEKVHVRLQSGVAYLSCLVTPTRVHAVGAATLAFRCEEVKP